MFLLRPSSFVPLAMLASVVGCGYELQDTARPSASGPSREQIRNTRYLAIEPQPLELRDGRYVGAPFVPGGSSRVEVTVFDELAVFGDLAGDGSTLAAVPLVAQAGGSGSWTYLAVIDGDARNVATAPIGDRVQLVGLALIGNRVRVTLITHGPDDAMCCPARWIEQDWALVDGALVASAASEPEPVSLDQLTGSRWMLERFGEADAGTTAAIDIVFDAARISGLAGCNNYFADLEDVAPGRISIGPVAATRRVCEVPMMDLETSYLEAIGVIDRYRFSMGRLVLMGAGADGAAVQLMLTRTTSATEP